MFAAGAAAVKFTAVPIVILATLVLFTNRSILIHRAANYPTDPVTTFYPACLYSWAMPLVVPAPLVP
jgi:hypothetical protein